MRYQLLEQFRKSSMAHNRALMLQQGHEDGPVRLFRLLCFTLRTEGYSPL